MSHKCFLMKVFAIMNRKGKSIVDNSKLVVGLVGMPGSGKSLVVLTAQELGYAIVVMGDVIRQETRNRGLELTPQNVGKVMLELRQEKGNYVIAQQCVPKIRGQNNPKVLIDGLRSLYEAEIFKENFLKFSLIAVHAPPEIRFQRLANRRRSDDTSEWQVFYERDIRELNVGLGNVIAMADEVIINNNSVEHVKAKIKKSLARIEERWSK
jgi:dephospho-CoA kinase